MSWGMSWALCLVFLQLEGQCSSLVVSQSGSGRANDGMQEGATGTWAGREDDKGIISVGGTPD